jgi:hypothetical protein
MKNILKFNKAKVHTVRDPFEDFKNDSLNEANKNILGGKIITPTQSKAQLEENWERNANLF